MNILKYLGEGKENAVTREQLVARTGMSDRKVRQLIEDARQAGAIIINAQDGRGYYIGSDPAELKRQLATNRRRALSILAQQKHLKRKIRELEGSDQVTLEEVSGDG